MIVGSNKMSIDMSDNASASYSPRKVNGSLLSPILKGK